MTWLLYLLSYLPFGFLHIVSRFNFALLYYGIRYRRTVVQENLLRSFPNETAIWRKNIEKKFYQNFCDLMVESLKTTSCSKSHLRKRCVFTEQSSIFLEDSLKAKQNCLVICSHLANWEWLPLALSLETKFKLFGVYKPLSSLKMNTFMLKTRERFGVKMITSKELRGFFGKPKNFPYLIGLVPDQAPHDYSKAFQFEFLNQMTYFFPGPGILCAQHGLLPVYVWMRRAGGRSRFEMGTDPIHINENESLSNFELEQIERVAKAHAVSSLETTRAYRIVKEYSKLLENQIKMAPEDWLWSHKRWKKR